MKYLIKQAKIIENGEKKPKKDILIENGRITQIENTIEVTDDMRLIESKNLHVSTGWLDIGAQLNEPGHEEKETIESLIDAAKNGGYTGLATFPNSSPSIDTKGTLNFVKQQFEKSTVDYFPIAALSKKCKGEELSEMVDLSEAGAMAYSDGMKSIEKGGTLLRGLQYVEKLNKPVFHHPHDKDISQGAEVHEGLTSTSLGLPGIPAIAETIMIKRDMDIVHYTESKIVEHNISTDQSMKLIKNNKSDQVMCSVAAMNLIHVDDSIKGFDANYKVQPPLRQEKDRKALIKGILKDHILYISSNHTPVEKELKDVEFTNSSCGASTLDTVFSSLNTLQDSIPLTKLIEKLTDGPRQALQIPIPKITVGEIANLTLFDPSVTWEVSLENIKSKSKNNPYIGQKLEGKVIGTFNNKRISLNK